MYRSTSDFSIPDVYLFDSSHRISSNYDVNKCCPYVRKYCVIIPSCSEESFHGQNIHNQT